MATVAQTVYDFTVLDIDKKPVSLKDYEGKVLLIVNVACACGLTSRNYSQLVEIYGDLADKGLEVIAFPCNQFGAQESGTNDEIKSFVKARNVSFPIMDKVEINGSKAIPLYKDFLKKKFPGDITWNFGKFLVDRSGQVVKRYEPTVNPTEIIEDIKALL